MRIVQLTPGTGNFYCGTCLRDNALVTALRQLGHDAILVPMYLPHFVDEPSVAEGKTLFFGGINVWLQQQSAFFRKTPRWVDRLFNSSALLKFAASRSGMTSARDLGEMTISMALGEDGLQAKELDKVVDWLARDENRPDVVSLSNILLIGLARRIRERLGVPVVCALQGEEAFIESLPDPARCWEVLRQRAADIDAFVAVSEYYKSVVLHRLCLAPARIDVVYNGINFEGSGAGATTPVHDPTIGYLARMHPSKGLAVLVEAFIALKSRGQVQPVRLKIAGNETPSDRKFVQGLRERLRRAGCEDAVEFLPNLDRAAKQAFLRTLDLLSVPAPREAFGLYLIEALACGIPVVQPNEGAFPELVRITGGGALYEPKNPESLAVAWETAFADRPRLAETGRRGYAVVSERFTSEAMARGFATVCDRVVRLQSGLSDMAG